MWRHISWLMVAGVPIAGTGLLWALVFGIAWPVWVLIGTGLALCLPVWLDCVIQEF